MIAKFPFTRVYVKPEYQGRGYGSFIMQCLEEDIQEVLQRGVYGRSVYGSISKESAEYIRSILYNEKYNIPKHLQKDIEFDLKFIVKG